MIPVHITENGECIASGNQAIKLYNLGRYGTPMKGGALRLSSFEVLHLLELRKIALTPPLDTAECAETFTANDPDFMGYYLVYKDLRFKGYVVGVSTSHFFRLYERGQKKENFQATLYVHPLKEGQNIPIKELKELLQESQQSQKSLVIALVDAGGDVSYMKIDSFNISENPTQLRLEYRNPLGKR